jgi:hypothetical protein
VDCTVPLGRLFSETDEEIIRPPSLSELMDTVHIPLLAVLPLMHAFSV